MTVAQLRQHWWIPRCRQRVRSILRQCIFCNRIGGKSYDQPPHAPLPSFRTKATRPFSITGLDYTGALIVRNQKKESKAYVALFTCTVTRAVHLELVPDNSTRSFLQAFRRFVSRRSTPSLIISDNASTFVAASKILKNIYDSPEVKECMLRQKVDWRFITPRAPWEGGFYERLIGVTKGVLKKCLGRAFVTFDELSTLITEAEAIINDRPISYVSNDLGDLPISPSHLLHGHLITPLPVVSPNNLVMDEVGFTVADISRRMKYRAKLLEDLWKRWQTDYLCALRERFQWSKPNHRRVSINDVVLVKSDRPRLMWKLGKIVKLHPSRGGFIRVVTVRTSTGEFIRPVSLLYPIECGSGTLPSYQLSSPQNDAPETDPMSTSAQKSGPPTILYGSSPDPLQIDQEEFDLGLLNLRDPLSAVPAQLQEAVPSASSPNRATNPRPARDAALKARLRWQKQ